MPKRRALNQPWYPGETLIAGIGQGYVLATPLQLATATAALANHGKRIYPRLVNKTSDPISGELTTLPYFVGDGAYWALVLFAGYST